MCVYNTHVLEDRGTMKEKLHTIHLVPLQVKLFQKRKIAVDSHTMQM